LESKTDVLIELAKKDIRIQALAEFLGRAPGLREELASERNAAKSEIEAKREEFDRSRRELARKEGELKDGEERINRLQAKLNQVKTNKEYDAALKEIEDQKKKNGLLEEDILRLYDEVEAAESKKKELEDAWKEKAAEFDARAGELDELEKAAGDELAKIEAERDAIKASLPAAVIEHYEKVKNHSGSGVARTDKEVCHGCYRHIPAQTYNLVLKGQDFISCPNCHRYLVHTEDELDQGLTEISL